MRSSRSIRGRRNPPGRGLALRPSPVAREAERFGLPIFTPKTLKENDAAEAMRAHGADAAVVVAYGLILPKSILETFPLGCFNLHASLLPRWRGAAPIHRAIMAGDNETGVMVMKMEEGLDTGADRHGGARADRRRRDHRRTARRTGAARRRPDAARARRAGKGPAAIDAASRRGRDLCQQDRQERDAHRLDQAVAAKSTTIAAGCRRFPAPGANSPAPGASRFCARPKATAAGRRAACSTTS